MISTEILVEVDDPIIKGLTHLMYLPLNKPLLLKDFIVKGREQLPSDYVIHKIYQVTRGSSDRWVRARLNKFFVVTREESSECVLQFTSLASKWGDYSVSIKLADTATNVKEIENND
jgi:hypothetical protein